MRYLLANIGRYEVLLCGVVLLGAVLRIHTLYDNGVIYPDDLRGYAGLEMVEILRDEEIPVFTRALEAHRFSIEGTGVRPLLAWFTAIPFVFGADTIASVYLLFSVCGILTIAALWVLCMRWFGLAAASLSALWLAVSPAHINYSRSALPPAPAMLLMVIGLLVLSGKRSNSRKGITAALFGAGWFFALAASFHPAYLLFVFLLPLWHMGTLAENGLKPMSLVRNGILDGAFLISPTLLLIFSYDAPNVIVKLAQGLFTRSDLRYLAGLWHMFNDPHVLGNQEGLFFWPALLFQSYGWMAVPLALIAVLGVVMGLRQRRAGERYHIIRVLTWLLVPWATFGLWPNLTSLGRLYAPLLLPLAVLSGLGSKNLANTLADHAKVPAPASLSAIAILTLGSGLPMTWTILEAPGRELAVAAYARQNDIGHAIGFLRTDRRVFADINLELVFQPSEFKQHICNDGTEYVILSPAPFYLVLRHHEYLFKELDLKPVYTYPNPYLASPRLMEGFSAEERQQVLADRNLAELGLFKVSSAWTCT